MEQVILGKQNRFGRSSEKMEDTSQICFQEVSNRNYKNIMIKTIKNVLMPMMIISVFMFYFRGWLVDGVSLMESVSYSAMDYRKVIETLLTWRNPVNGMGHLWYLYVYILVMISFPVLKSFVDYLTQNNRREIYFLIISLTLFLVNDITENQLLAFSHYSINGWFPASIEVIWGGYFVPA